MDLSISQNFTTNNKLVAKLVRITDINEEDIVFDIGAGAGVISTELAKTAKKVYAVELDKKFEFALKEATKSFPNVEVIMGDFLKLPLPENSKYKVFSNIPFSITSDIVYKLMFAKNPPEDAVLFVQKEAAYRFMGEGEGYLISILIKPFFDVEIAYEFKKSDFTPQPSVNIVLLEIKKRQKPLVDIQNAENYQNFVIYTLKQQKPTLKLRLNKIFTSKQFYKLSKDLNFSEEISASELEIDQWIGLFNYYLVGVEASKKKIVDEIGQNYIQSKANFSGPSRTKIRL